MTRKNIFESIKDNYDIFIEIEKVYDNLENYDMFGMYKVDRFSREEKFVCAYKFFDFCDRYLFGFLPEIGTCRDIDEFMEYADAELSFGKNKNLTEERIINFLEVVENLFYIFFKKYRSLKRRHGLDYYIDPYDETRFLIDELEKHIGLSKLEYDDRVILYKGDPKIDQALQNVSKPELVLELIQYKKETKTSIEKRKILKQLDVLTEPITDAIKKKYNPANDLDCILNNFDLRHNNSDPKSKDYKPKVATLTEEQLCEIYDVAYELILDTLMLDDYDSKLSNKVSSFKTFL